MRHVTDEELAHLDRVVDPNAEGIYGHVDAKTGAAIAALLSEIRVARLADRDMRKVFVTHVYDAADHLHDYYVHQTAEGAVRQAATDVVNGRFEDADPDFFEVELRRVIDAAYEEPGVGRRHVCCDAWRAHVDEMQVLP